MPIGHRYFVDVIKKLYPLTSSDEGICHGLACVSMQAILCGELNQFVQRLNVIKEKARHLSADDFVKEIKDIEANRTIQLIKLKEKLLKDLGIKENLSDFNFYQFLKEYEEKKKNENVLNPIIENFYKDRDKISQEPSELADTHAFFELIMLYFSPQMFPEFFEKNAIPGFQDTERTFVVGLPDKLQVKSIVEEKKEGEQNSIFSVITKPLVNKVATVVGFYKSDEELINYFRLLRSNLPHVTPPVVFQLGSINHAITVTYDTAMEKWMLIDANNIENPIPLLSTDAEIAREVRSAFFSNNGAAFSTEIYCHAKKFDEINESLNKKLITAKDWIELHKIEGKEMLVDNQEATLFSLAVRNNDINLVRELLESKEFKIDIDTPDGKVNSPMTLATLNGYTDIIALLLASKDGNGKFRIDVNKKNTDGITPFYNAIFEGKADYVRLMLAGKDDSNQSRVTVRAIKMKTDLLRVHAFKDKHSREELTALLREKNIPPSGFIEDFTPIHAAVFYGNQDILKQLIAANFDVNLKTKEGINAFELAKVMGNTEIIEILRQAPNYDKAQEVKPKPPEAKDVDTLFLYLNKGKTADVIKSLENKDENNKFIIDANSVNENGETPLWIASQRGYLGVVKYLLECKKESGLFRVNVNLPDADGIPPLYAAIQKGNLPIVQVLLASRDDNNNNKPRVTANSIKMDIDILLAHATVKKCSEEFKQLLQDKNISVDALRGFTPLHAAVFYGRKDIVNALLAADFNVNATTKEGISVFELAKAMNQTEIMKMIQEAPGFSDVHEVKLHLSESEKKSQLLYEAVRDKATVKAIKELLDSKDASGKFKEDVNQTDVNGVTPLHIAVGNKQINIVDALLESKDANGNFRADVNVADKNGMMPLYVAAKQGSAILVHALLDSKDENSELRTNRNGIAINTHYLLDQATDQMRSAFQILLNNKNLTEDHLLENFTPLHMAVFFGHKHVVRALLENGFKNETTKEGISVFDLATAMNQKEIIDILRPIAEDVNLQTAKRTPASVIYQDPMGNWRTPSSSSVKITQTPALTQTVSNEEDQSKKELTISSPESALPKQGLR